MAHTEAPTSATYKLTSPKGFGVLFTVRGDDSKELLQEMITIESSLVDLGYQVATQSYGRGKPKDIEWVEGRTCPKDGGRIQKITTKGGKVLFQCENRKYDFTTKTTSGCDFVEWQEDVGSGEPVKDGFATPAQKKLLEEKGLWEVGMTKVQASEVITEALAK